jgi:nucleotide-binding universal stress UspA family protein
MSLARIFGARLELVRVWNVSTPASTVAPYAIDAHQTLFAVMLDATEESVVAYLGSVKARLRPDGAEIRITALCGDAAAQLRSYISTTRPAMVVIGTHGRSGIARWMQGSVAAEIVRVGIAPVLLVRPAVASVQRDIARMEASAGPRSSDRNAARYRQHRVSQR